MQAKRQRHDLETKRVGRKKRHQIYSKRDNYLLDIPLAECDPVHRKPYSSGYSPKCKQSGGEASRLTAAF